MTPQQEAAQAAAKFVDKIDTEFLFPFIILLSAVAFLVFLYGCAVYVINANNDTARAEGKKSIFFGIIGLTIIVSAYGLFNLAVGTFGLSSQLDCASSENPENCVDVFDFTPAPSGSGPGSGSGTIGP